MDFVNNLNAVVGEYIHLFNQQIGQFEGQHIRFCNRVNDFLSAALAGLFLSLQPCLGGDSSIGIFDFQYFCVINCFLRFICVQLDLPQEIPFKESLLLVLQNFQLLLILRAFQCSYCRIYNPPGKGGYKGQSHISALAQHLLTMLKFALEAETNRNPLFS